MRQGMETLRAFVEENTNTNQKFIAKIIYVEYAFEGELKVFRYTVVSKKKQFCRHQQD
jgi:hypothetical protein